jgi:hypothetical protein
MIFAYFATTNSVGGSVVLVLHISSTVAWDDDG